MTPGALRIALSFGRDRRGVAALEFALIFPFMMSLLFGGVELTNALEARRKTTVLASTVSDLVAQVKAVNDTDVDNVFAAAQTIMAPFDESSVKIVLSSIVRNSDGEAVVAWSDGYHENPRPEGQKLTPDELPDGVLITGSSVIMAEVSYNYTSPLSQFITGTMEMRDTFFSRPRRTNEVKRT